MNQSVFMVNLVNDQYFNSISNFYPQGRAWNCAIHNDLFLCTACERFTIYYKCKTIDN